MSSQGKPSLSMKPAAVKRRRERALLRELKAKCGQPSVAPTPKKKASKKGNFSAQTRVEKGTDVLGVVTMQKDDAVGTSLLRFQINPLDLPDSRLSQFATLWQRWAPRKLRLEVSSAAGMMIPGSYIVGWAADPNETLYAHGEGNVRKLTSLGCSIQKPVGQNASLTIPCAMSRKWYAFKGVDAFDEKHGVLLGALAGTLGAANVSLTLKLHWEVAFNGPELPTAEDFAIIKPGDGYENCFTDSVSDWASGERLTFKHAKGGSVVPWVGIDTGYVYQLVPPTKINYVKSDGSKGNVEWFSCIVNSSLYQTALVCHLTQADAVAYQVTGDLTKVIKYKDAGDAVSNPILKGQPITKARLDLSTPGQSLPQPKPRTSTQPPPPPEVFPDHLIDTLLERLLARLDSRLGSLPVVGSESSSSLEVVEPEN